MSSTGGKRGPGGKDSSKEASPTPVAASGEASPAASTTGKSENGTATTARDAAQRLLVAASKSEWPAVDQLLKTLEKAAQSQGEDAPPTPLAGLADSVGIENFRCKRCLILRFF